VEVCEPNEKSLEVLAGEMGRPLLRHRSFEEAVASHPEMMLIATPPQLHAAQTVAALQAGCHVLCEKPMSDSSEGAQQMTDAAHRFNRCLSIGFTMHFHPMMQRLKAILNSQVLGELLHVHAHVGTYITLLNSGSSFQATLEGALLMDYTHQPDLFQWWLGQAPRGVYMRGFRGGTLEKMSTPNVACLTMDYAGSLIATIHLNYVQMPDRHEYEVVGDRGWLHYDLGAGVLRVGMRETRTVTEEKFVVERDPMYEAEHQAFFDAVDGRRAVESPGIEAMQSTRVIDAALRSWREGRRVELP
jgi:predicted dehydrogenase